MTRSVRSVVCALLSAAALGFACDGSTNPPLPPDVADPTGGDAGSDSGAGGGAGGGTGGGGGGGEADGGEATCEDVDAGAIYTAPIQATGASRFFIQREAAVGATRCVQMSFVASTSSATDGGLSVPSGWVNESTRYRDRACSAGGNGGYANATDARGVVTFTERDGGADAGNPFPASVSVQAVVFGGGTAGGFPPDELCMSAVDVPVTP